MAGERHGKTLFIRNLPYSTTNEKLEKVFSEIGPIKSSFVVSDKDSGKCRGFGYVKFTLLEDAEKALQTIKKVDGRNVQIIYANKKEKKKKFGRPVTADSEKETEATQEQTPEKQPAVTKTKKVKKTKTEVPVKGVKQAPNPLNEGKRARLIVRNLSFKCTPEDLKSAFEKCGTVNDVHIPKKANGQKLGFGFVQFANKTQAGMAVKELNGKAICGRVVAIDWTLPKDKFETQRANTKKSSEAKLDDDEDSEEDDDSDDEEEDMEIEVKEETDIKKENETDSKKKAVNSKDKKNIAGSTVDTKKTVVDSKSKNIHNDGTKINTKNTSVDSKNKKIVSRDESSEEDESDDSSGEEKASDNSADEESDEDSEDEDSGIENESDKKSKKIDRPSDVNEGRTVFIRNLPFSTVDEDLEEFFSQFGVVNYGRIVFDHATGISRGSAFVQFQSKDSADSCLKAASDQDTGLSLGGRQIVVTMAVSRQQAGDLIQNKEKEKEKKDSRNLYLAREGMIREGTEAAKDVPVADLIKRAKIIAANRTKLKDQNIFVSSTRLCVHNLPSTVTDQALRKVVYQAAQDKAAKITECRIMRDLSRLNSQGVGKSRGFAFCSFTQHEHALKALRNLNNNPKIFGDKKRPIVEFSLENRKALEIKQKRIEKSNFKCQQKALEMKAANSASKEAEKKKRKRKPKPWKTAPPLDVLKAQDKVARSLHQGPLGLPSHSGPKMRHKKRPGQEKFEKKKLKKNFNKQPQKFSQKAVKQKPKQIQKPNKKRKDFDSFDKLVASYKQKIMSATSSKMK
ncbi:RNA-binding protein 28-like [Physella acuta]|uniref:RNA-binding protein 28-like n=1 Tax=Physella acuta TaxID=109671 RepID=UPI0027DDE24C|nr:RNA-binding protein 28-like [Physella acuta]